MSDPILRLSELFEKFPGIGPRQAGRFVQYLLRNSPSVRHELADAITDLSGAVRQCPECRRHFAGTGTGMCGLCANPARDKTLLAIVANDTDLLALERSGTFRGMYFVLGGTISLASEKISHLRTDELIESLPRRAALAEIVLAFPANPEGDATAVRIREELQARASGLKVTTLGRGLSTGSELEYADPETIRNALDGRR